LPSSSSSSPPRPPADGADSSSGRNRPEEQPLDSGYADTEPVTLNIRSGLLPVLEADADGKDMSLDDLANHVFTSYIEWDMVAAKVGWAVLQRDVLREVFAALTDGQIVDIATRTADAARGVRLSITGSDTLGAFYLVLRNRLRKSGFEFQETAFAGKRRIVINHGMGRKWSLFFKIHYGRMLDSLGHPATFDATDNVLAMTIKER
jgi:hypothetical protein